jgi:hypothetical protein
MVGKDPWKVDRCGQLRARQLAKRIVQGGYYDSKVTLTWSPRREFPLIYKPKLDMTSIKIGLNYIIKAFPPPRVVLYNRNP